MQEDGIHFDVIKSKYTGSSHSILIKPYEDERLLELLQQGYSAYFQSRDSGYGALPAAFASKFVHGNVRCSKEVSETIHEKHHRANTIPYLGEFIDASVCREKNLIAHLLVANLGYPTEYVIGNVRNREGKLQDHAWLYSPLTEESIDAVKGCAMPWKEYDELFCSWPNFSQIFARPHHEIWGWTLAGNGFGFRR